MIGKIVIRWIARIGLVVATTALACSSTPAEVVPCSPQDTNGVLCAQVARGNADFHDGALVGLNGNGRACSDCHMDADSFQLSPADVEARFQAMSTTGIDDPLFRPIDADDFDTNGANASDYSNLRQNGLVRVRLPLPANIKLVDPASCSTGGVAAPCDTAATYAVSNATTTDVWRLVPSVFNVKLTGYDPQTRVWPRGPDPQGGYQLDGRVDTLQSQALGAFQNHAQVTTDSGRGDARRPRRLRRDPVGGPRTGARRPRGAGKGHLQPCLRELSQRSGNGQAEPPPRRVRALWPRRRASDMSTRGGHRFPPALELRSMPARPRKEREDL